jgi:hypothetical protein
VSIEYEAVGLGPLVKTLPTFGKTEAAVKILGTDLTGATSVTFNGTAATFTVVSASKDVVEEYTGQSRSLTNVVPLASERRYSFFVRL